MRNLSASKMNDNDFQRPDRTTGKLRLVLIIFLFLFLWSLFALMSAKITGNSFLSLAQSNNSLAYSLILELISNYFSFFTLTSMGGVLLSFLAAFTSCQLMIKRKTSDIPNHYIRDYLLNSAFFTNVNTCSIIGRHESKNDGLLNLLKEIGGPAQVKIDASNGLLITSERNKEKIGLISFSDGDQVYLEPVQRLIGIISGEIKKIKSDMRLEIWNKSALMEDIEIGFFVNPSGIPGEMSSDAKKEFFIKLIADDFESFISLLEIQIKNEFRKFVRGLLPEDFDLFIMSLGVSPIARISKQKGISPESEETSFANSFQKYPRIFSKRNQLRRNRKFSIYPFLDFNIHQMNNLPESGNPDTFIMKIIGVIEEKMAIFYGFRLIHIDSIKIGRVIIND